MKTNILFFRVPKGLEDVSKYPDLFDELAKETNTHRPWTRQDLQNLASGNLLRVMRAVEKQRDDSKGEKEKIEICEDQILVADLGKNTDCRTFHPDSKPDNVDVDSSALSSAT